MSIKIAVLFLFSKSGLTQGFAGFSSIRKVSSWLSVRCFHLYCECEIIGLVLRERPQWHFSIAKVSLWLEKCHCQIIGVIVKKGSTATQWGCCRAFWHFIRIFDLCSFWGFLWLLQNLLRRWMGDEPHEQRLACRIPTFFQGQPLPVHPLQSGT